MKELLVQIWTYLFLASIPIAIGLGQAMKAGWIKESNTVKSIMLLLASFFLGSIIAVLFKSIYLLAIPPILTIIKIVVSWREGIGECRPLRDSEWEWDDDDTNDPSSPTYLPSAGLRD